LSATGRQRYLVITPAGTLSGTTSIQVIVYDPDGGLSSSSFNLRVEPGAGPLVINAQPQDVTVFPGDAAFLGIGVRGSAPPTFQWFANGHRMEGATNSFLAVTNAQPSDTGNYSVVVSSENESVSSRPARLYVRAPVMLLASIHVPNGGLSIKVLGEPGDRYGLFRSCNLGVWQLLATLTNQVGSLEYRDGNASVIQFYRAVLEQ
jgi:Immunoglobulin domain